MKSVNLQRTESLLCELIPEALSNLQDSQINNLTITGVECKNGKYHAIVYFDGADFSPNDIKHIIQKLEKANGRIKANILATTGWYKCPDFKFEIDLTLENSKKLEKLFSQIAKEK